MHFATGAALALLLVTFSYGKSAAAGEMGQATRPAQIPLCMIGDSITWADDGDCWRKDLLAEIPALAFVGTHTAKFGYSHAGEGGNNTARVLARLDAIPDCLYYHLHIGTNNNNIKDAARMNEAAAYTAGEIVKIVNALLKKPGVKKIFLASVFPCHTDNPLRDQTNRQTNVFLRERLSSFPKGMVAYVDYETVIRDTPGWEEIIRLHPSPEGYKLVAHVLAEALRRELGLQDVARVPKPLTNTGVAVRNLWRGDESGQTSISVIAGWYTLSLNATEVGAGGGTITLTNAEEVQQPLSKSFPVAAADAGKRLTFSFFTGYEGYGYTRTPLKLKLENCHAARILLEKQRPSGKASTYGEGEYVDTLTPPQPGELVTSAQ